MIKRAIAIFIVEYSQPGVKCPLYLKDRHK